MGHKRVYVVTDVANINIKSNSYLLGAGEIGIYGIETATGRTVKATTSNVLDSIGIALGRGATLNSLRSPDINLPIGKKELLWKKALYAVPVNAQVQVATECLPDGAYDSFIMKIAHRFDDDEGDVWNTKSYSVDGVYADRTAMYAALAAKVNGDADAIGTATSSAAGVVITTKIPVTAIELGFEYGDGEWRPGCMTCSSCNSTVTKLNEFSQGEGTWYHLRRHLDEARGHMGTHFTNDRFVPQPEDTFDGISRSGTWDFYFLNWQNLNQAKGDTQMVMNIWQEAVIAVPSGTNFAAFTQVIDFQIGQNLSTAII